MDRAQAVSQLLRDWRHVWTARDIAPVRACRSGFAELDAMLPGQGWPLSALIELLPATEGIGELSLAMPALKRLCAAKRDVVFIRPPHLPYPPALAKAGLPLNRIVWIETTDDNDARWAAEQTLREGTAGAVLLWSDVSKDVALRRLQVAAREGAALTFLYRSPGTRIQHSPAAVRISLRASQQGMHIDILKAQGGRTGNVTLLQREAAA